MEQLKLDTTAIRSYPAQIQSFVNRVYNPWKNYKDYYQGDKSPRVLVEDESGIPVFLFHQVTAIKECQSKVIAIDLMCEGLNTFLEDRNLKQWVEILDKSKHYIMFVNGWWDPELVTELKEYNYTLLNYSMFLFDYTNMLLTSTRPLGFYHEKKYDFDCDKPMVFVSTIGTYRQSRSDLVTNLTSNLEYNNFILKYKGQDFGMPSSQFEFTKVNKLNFNPYIDLTRDSGITVPWPSLSHTIPIEMYNQAHFNLVVETCLGIETKARNFHLTEKTIKALITGIPFVIASTPYFLEELRNLGFTTYNSLWDESYDTEEDTEKRMDKIVSLCNELALFDWDGFKEELKQIRYKNLDRIIELNKLTELELSKMEEVIKNLDIPQLSA